MEIIKKHTVKNLVTVLVGGEKKYKVLLLDSTKKTQIDEDAFDSYEKALRYFLEITEGF